MRSDDLSRLWHSRMMSRPFATRPVRPALFSRPAGHWQKGRCYGLSKEIMSGIALRKSRFSQGLCHERIHALDNCILTSLGCLATATLFALPPTTAPRIFESP